MVAYMTEEYQTYDERAAMLRAEAKVVSDLVDVVCVTILDIWTGPPSNMDPDRAMDRLNQIPILTMLEQTGVPALDKERREALAEKLGRELAAKYFRDAPLEDLPDMC